MKPGASPIRGGVAGDVTALISTHRTESAGNLAASLGSLRRQTLPPVRIVLVVDGPVDDAQEAVIAAFGAGDVPALDVVRLERNVGLADAMNAGLERCATPWVMRMDSDDLCLPDRLEVQAAYLATHPEIDVVSSWSEEFFEDGSPSQVKVSPVNHPSIVRALRWRNVLVHPTIVVRTETLRRIGGYRARYGRLEDYDLFVRLIQAGARFHVIPKILVRVRSSVAQKQRRGGLAYCLGEIRFRYECYRTGFTGLVSFVGITALYVVFRLLSGTVKRRIYALARS